MKKRVLAFEMIFNMLLQLFLGVYADANENYEVKVNEYGYLSRVFGRFSDIKVIS